MGLESYPYAIFGKMNPNAIFIIVFVVLQLLEWISMGNDIYYCGFEFRTPIPLVFSKIDRSADILSTSGLNLHCEIRIISRYVHFAGCESAHVIAFSCIYLNPTIYTFHLHRFGLGQSFVNDIDILLVNLTTDKVTIE